MNNIDRQGQRPLGPNPALTLLGAVERRSTIATL
jgi:hypothetical protein